MAGYHLAMNAGTVNTLFGIFFLIPILLGLWLALRAIVRSRSSFARGALVLVIVWLLVYPPVRIAIAGIRPGEILCAAALTAAIVFLHGKFGRQ